VNSMKTYRPILLLIAIISLASGCTEDFLKLDNPNKKTTASYWKNLQDLESGLATVYKAFSENNSWSYWQRTNMQLVEGKTENFTISQDVISRYQISIFTNTPENIASQEIFRGCYIGIFRANQVIHYAGLIDTENETLRDQITAEAKFCRGLNYFNLVNEFGSVPIITELAEGENDYYKRRYPIEEVWLQVITDFQEAKPYLPYRYPEDQKGRATRGAAIAYLGKAYLYTGQWEAAIREFEEIVSNESLYGYGLMDKYAENFDGQHENNRESIFEIQYSRLRAPVWGGASATSTVMAQECAPFEKGGWEELKPTRVLLDVFLKEKTSDGGFDPRALATIAWSYPGCIHYQSVFDSVWEANEVYLRKNQNWWNENEGDWRSGLNQHPMRYADVLLMLAEAYTMNGDVEMAVTLVHRIRERAELPDRHSEMIGWTEAQMMTEIRHQRNLEFVRELLHWFDLKRWGILEETIKNSGTEGYQNYVSRYAYYPIPDAELKNNPSMTQNDLWNPD